MPGHRKPFGGGGKRGAHAKADEASPLVSKHKDIQLGLPPDAACTSCSVLKLLVLLVTVLLASSLSKAAAHSKNWQTVFGGTRDFTVAQGCEAFDGLTAAELGTFRGFYCAHRAGRGIWKWSHYLDAYQRHFARFVGHAVALAEVGVQSGGSVLMWQSVLGSKCHVFGIDINPASQRFADDKTTIIVGDQADPLLWDRFFSSTTAAVDILIDDGSHQPAAMLRTLSDGFPRLSPGGVVAIEDNHGSQFVESFFCPAATLVDGWRRQGQVAAIHVYPFLFLAEKAPVSSQISGESGSFAACSIVSSFPEVWDTISRSTGHCNAVALENKAWGSFFAEGTLCGIFGEFRLLHEWDALVLPSGCGDADAGACVISITNTQVQNRVLGLHIFPERLVVEVAVQPPTLEAVRMGTDWVPWYGAATNSSPPVQRRDSKHGNSRTALVRKAE